MSSYYPRPLFSTCKVRSGLSSSVPYLDQIDFVESLIASRLLNVEDGNDVLVVEVSEKLHLSECPQAKHGVVEGCYLLDRDFLSRGFVDGRAVQKLSWLGVVVQIGPNCRCAALTRQRHRRPHRQHLECHTARSH